GHVFNLIGALGDDWPYADENGTGGTHFWDTSGLGGGGGVHQSIVTTPGASYDLSILLSSFNEGASFEVVWNGNVIASYDGTPLGGGVNNGAAIGDTANWTAAAGYTVTVTPVVDTVNPNTKVSVSVTVPAA